jgi:hypothetical protein
VCVSSDRCAGRRQAAGGGDSEEVEPPLQLGMCRATQDTATV